MNKLALILLFVIFSNYTYSDIAIASATIKENVEYENIKTYYVSNEKEKISTLNLIKSNMETKVNIVYSGKIVPKSKKELKFYYSKDTFNSFNKYYDNVYNDLYTVGSYAGFGINNVIYNSDDKTITVTYNFSYYDTKEESERANEIINSAIKDNISTLDTDYQKALWAYQWVIDNVYYDKTLNNFSAYSGLTDLGTVCIGYATIYSALINKMGLDCRVVEGSVYNSKGNNHAWNIIKLDGEWYCVDTTWGDGDIFDKYFLKSQKTFMSSDYGFHNSNIYLEYEKAGEIFAETDYIDIDEKVCLN